MSFTTASAILRGGWLLQKEWANAQMPLVVRLLKGESADFGFSEKKEEKDESCSVLTERKAGSVYTASPYSSLNDIPEGSIVKLTIAGPIMKYGDMCSYGSVEYERIVNKLRVATNVAGVIIEMDSPGGQVAGTAMLADAIAKLAQQKPVIGWINDGIAASAGMWIISAAPEIYVSQKTDMVGSIGVYTTIADWYAYYAAEGLPVRDVYAPQSTDKNGEYRDALEGDDTQLKAELSTIAQEFISTISRNRSGKINGKDWTTGKMYYPDEAKRIGLIDGMKSLDEVITRMDALIRSRKQASKSNNNMAFTKTLAAAKADAFEVVEGGFLCEESHLNNIEATLTQNETALSQANSNLATAQAELQASKAENATLVARVAALEKGDASTVTTAPPVATDKFSSDDKKKKYGNTSYDKMLVPR